MELGNSRGNAMNRSFKVPRKTGKDCSPDRGFDFAKLLQQFNSPPAAGQIPPATDKSQMCRLPGKTLENKPCDSGTGNLSRSKPVFKPIKGKCNSHSEAMFHWTDKERDIGRAESAQSAPVSTNQRDASEREDNYDYVTSQPTSLTRTNIQLSPNNSSPVSQNLDETREDTPAMSHEQFVNSYRTESPNGPAVFQIRRSRNRRSRDCSSMIIDESDERQSPFSDNLGLDQPLDGSAPVNPGQQQSAELQQGVIPFKRTLSYQRHELNIQRPSASVQDFTRIHSPELHSRSPSPSLPEMAGDFDPKRYSADMEDIMRNGNSIQESRRRISVPDRSPNFVYKSTLQMEKTHSLDLPPPALRLSCTVENPESDTVENPESHIERLIRAIRRRYQQEISFEDFKWFQAESLILALQNSHYMDAKLQKQLIERADEFCFTTFLT